MKWHRDLFSFWAYAIPSEKGLDVKSNLNHKNTSMMKIWKTASPDARQRMVAASLEDDASTSVRRLDPPTAGCTRIRDRTRCPWEMRPKMKFGLLRYCIGLTIFQMTTTPKLWMILKPAFLHCVHFSSQLPRLRKPMPRLRWDWCLWWAVQPVIWMEDLKLI